MSTQRPSEEETYAKLNETFIALDQERSVGLQRMQQLQNIKQQAQQREKARLTVKYGENHPRVVKIDERMRYDAAANIELQYEIEKTQIEVPKFDRNSWLLQGRVLDQDRKGVAGLTLSLFDENDQWVEELGHACSNGHGYFALRYQVEEDQKPGIPNTTKCFLSVTDAENQLRHREVDPLYVNIGVIDSRLIVLNEVGGTCRPPKAGSEGSGSLPGDAWIARGTVMDKAGNLLAGLIVSLYDKDLLFDDYLGTTTTDDNGCFQLIYRTEAFNKLFDSNPDLYLKIVDSSGKELYNSRKPVRSEVGKVEDFTITLPAMRKGK